MTDYSDPEPKLLINLPLVDSLLGELEFIKIKDAEEVKVKLEEAARSVFRKLIVDSRQKSKLQA